MKVYLFPGQGSQARGMGKALFGSYTEMVRTADEVLGYSVEELCLADPRSELNQTRFTQPAIYVVSALAYQDELLRAGHPDYVAGHSLGEFNALLAAGCFDFETGLRLVQKRAELMSQMREGAMAAVLNMPAADIARVLADNGLDEIDIANLNTPSQTVISGSKAQIVKAQDLFTQGRTQYIPLNTSGAFHSRLMAPAQQAFTDFLAGFEFRPPRIPVIANVSARSYAPGEVATNLAKQITGSVRWSESIQYLMAQAAAAGQTPEFSEVGHGDVLTRMVQKIKAESPVPAAPHTPQERVRQWNLRHPVGTRVRSSVLPDAVLETRTQAMVLFQHRAAVYLQGYNGYFDLDELVPA